ncbi:MAG: type I DNA topoisomerase [Rickettsiaceae bacterium]|nr:type I DNA topoisomerase [Rickettsiaceae bacterium]
MKLVIVESPAKAKTINKYLGSDFKVVASFGHIRDLPSKNGSVLPDNNFEMKYEIPAKSAAHVKAICEAAKSAEAIYLATDPDREGEAISWHVVEALREKKALKKDVLIKRVAFNEITKKAVSQAIASPRDIDTALVDAQQARRALDYLVGFTLSPVLWKKLPGSRSAGRVQSVALRLICDREHEIERFVTQEYWDISADMLSLTGEDFTARLANVNGEKLEKFSITNKEQAEKISEALKLRSYKVSSVEKKQQKRHPQPPFTTSSMQQEAARKLGFSAKKTMQIAQKLYEGIELNGEQVGLITYMRTDGVSISEDAIKDTREYIKSAIGEDYLPESAKIYKSKAKNAQEAHEAIRPTNVNLSPEKLKSSLESDFFKLYDLIWKRLVASQMESVVLDVVTAIIESDDKNYILRAVGSVISFDGFYKIYKEGTDDSESEESRLLPILNEGDAAEVRKVNPAQHFTEPPPRFTEASLVKKLEELGIGRPSTYASIISVLQDRNYVTLEKKRFMPEERGILVTAFLVNLFKKYVEYDFTADLENELDEIAEGKLPWKEMLSKFWQGFHDNVDFANQYKISDVISKLNEVLSDHLFPAREDGKDPKKCDACGTGELGLKLGKFGAFIACSNYPECKFTRQIVQNESPSEGGDGVSEAPGADENNKLLGENSAGVSIYLKKGPYGWYIQEGEGLDKTEKPKRSSLPPATVPQSVDLSVALNLLSLPKLIGKHPETDQDIHVGIGKFGPYIKHASKFVSIPKGEDIFSVTVERAVEIIASGKK